ncbi:hypothetical protein [Eubacterium limosum]|uniref:hypothetical protein n=1 Tax=Eubacterium limosum TaxID=1736 RepID=UPI0010637CEA|nr:hypothetical protein [Eubacterium limosum]
MRIENGEWAGNGTGESHLAPLDIVTRSGGLDEKEKRPTSTKPDERKSDNIRLCREHDYPAKGRNFF